MTMLDGQQVSPIAEGLFTGPPTAPRLIGSRCGSCGTITFPRQPSCPRCASLDVEERPLARRGTLWTWTIQCFPPKSPPYVPVDPDEFEPYGVGYVELADEVRVEARLTESDPTRLVIGMPMELVLIPAPGVQPTGVVTFAFRPVDEEVDG
jgi:uncharacterized OB-fold protein